MKLKAFKLCTLFFLIIVLTGQMHESVLANTGNNSVLKDNISYKSITDGDKEVLKIGDEYLGGIIFYVYTEEKDGEKQQHGLIVSITETTAKWQNAGEVVEADKFDDGVYNTKLMRDSPAKDWVEENFSEEWYLPAIDELNLLWESHIDLNRILRANSHPLISVNGNYWSSTESSKANAFGFNFSRLGNRFSRNKANLYRIRAIRTF